MKLQFPGDIPEVSSTGLHIPDDSELGTGTFSVMLAPGAFAGTQPFAPRIVNPSIFGIVASVNPGKGILVGVYRSDGQKPTHQLGYLIPDDLNAARSHTLTVEFVGWRILSCAIDGVQLAITGRSATGH